MGCSERNLGFYVNEFGERAHCECGVVNRTGTIELTNTQRPST